MSKTKFYEMWHPENFPEKYFAERLYKNMKFEETIKCPVSEDIQDLEKELATWLLLYQQVMLLNYIKSGNY